MSLFGGSGSALTSPRSGIAAAQRGRDQYRSNINEGSDNLKTYLGDKARQEIIDAQANAKGDLQSGVSQAQPYLQQAADLWDPLTQSWMGLADKYGGLADQWGGLATRYGGLADQYAGLAPGDLSARAMYLNTLGLNGAEGNQAAVDAFHVSPGYQFQVDEANKNILRNGAATGNVLSGNVGIALNDRAQQLANQEYGTWQNRLSDQGNNIYKDYSGVGAAYGGMGNAYTGQGNAYAGIGSAYSGAGNTLSNKASALNNLANLFANEGTGLASLDQWGGGARSGLYENLGTNLNANNQLLAQNDYNRAANINNAQQAAAENSQAQQQAWLNALGDLGGNLLSAAGTARGVGNLFSFA